MKITGFYGNETEVQVRKHRYVLNDNLAISLLTEEGEPFGMLTKNLKKKLPENMAYLDVNNMPDAEKFVTENNLGRFTGMYSNSGFIVYPLYEFF